MRLLFEVLICLVKKEFFKLLGAATIQGRLLFEGGHYWRLYGILFDLGIVVSSKATLLVAFEGLYMTELNCQYSDIQVCGTVSKF